MPRRRRGHSHRCRDYGAGGGGEAGEDPNAMIGEDGQYMAAEDGAQMTVE